MRQAVIYLRVSTIDQTTANQERELREIAGRMGCEIVKVYRDHGISGAKGRDKRPAFDKLCRDAALREFDMVMAWSVDRLGRSLLVLVGLGAFEALGDQAGAEGLGGSPDAFGLAVDQDADLLEVRLELASGTAGDLDADAAQVLGLAAVGALTANLGATAGINAFMRHGELP